jgi:SAM-dependent methyltransferase/dienelactone hydrolase
VAEFKYEYEVVEISFYRVNKHNINSIKDRESSFNAMLLLNNAKTHHIGSAEVPTSDCMSEPIDLFSKSGKKLSAYLDRPKGLPTSGMVIIAPAYGETKENNILISSYFVSNGFCAIRFDWSEHVGESEGEIFTCTLSEMMNDLVGLVEYQKSICAEVKIGIVATSLAGRVALRMASFDKRVDFLVTLAPVVDLRHTLWMTYREDLVGNYEKGKRYGTLDVLGFNIDADGFLRDAVQNGFSDLSNSLLDAEQIEAPTFMCVGEKDIWVRAEDARAVFEAVATRKKQFVTMPSALHRFVENRSAMKYALRRTIHFAIINTLNRDFSVEEVEDPISGEVRTRQFYEKSLLKGKYDYSKSEEREFWSVYLSRFNYIYNIRDYWILLENIYDNLGGAWSGQRILDAGCGNGNYGFFLLLKKAYKYRQSPQLLGTQPCLYYGVDFVQEAVYEAHRRIEELQQNLLKGTGASTNYSLLLRSEFAVADLEVGVPFPDNFFDQICCNLVVSYLQTPEKDVAELCRVLRPGGRLVVSSLKPNPDLSEIYRNFVAVADNEEEIVQARKLLSNAGAIKVKEVRGLYHFYSEGELKKLFRRCGLRQIRVLRSFGDQANVIIGRKNPPE